MQKIIDLTHPIIHGQPVFPGDPEVKLSQVAEVSRDGFTNYFLETGMHSGTHIDGPLHKIADAPYLSGIPIGNFIGNAVVLDLRGKMEIDWREEYCPMIKGVEAVLFKTGHSQYYGTDRYYQSYPALHAAWIERLAEYPIRIIGLDSPSPDRSPWPVHQALLSRGIMIIENLTNLDSLPSNKVFELIALPLKIQSDSAPVRVVARID